MTAIKSLWLGTQSRLDFTAIHWISLLVSALVLYSVSLVVYRLYFHPLRHVPGPWIAAATQWYEFYYDVLKWPGGQYMHTIDAMHDKYVHLRKSEWINVLCTGGYERRDKYPPAARMTGTPLGTFGTVKHEVHRLRRSAVKGFFAQKVVDGLAPIIHEKTTELCNLLRKQVERDGYTELRTNLLAFGTDLLCILAFDTDFLRLLKDEEKAQQWQSTISTLAFLTPLVKQLPWLIPFSRKIPIRVLEVTAPPFARIFKLHHLMGKAAQVEIDELQEKSLPLVEKGFFQSKIAGPTRLNVFKTILQSPILPEEEKSQERLTQEATVFIAAGGETCARSIAAAISYISSGPSHVLPRLMEEIKSVYLDSASTPSVADLVKLPYLTAVIKESLRLTGLISSRLPLIAPDRALQFGEYVIPPGNPVSISLRDIQQDPEIFKNPQEFRPERWLPEDPEYELTSKYHVPFGRGTRGCVGINLAYAQLYIVISRLLREFSMTLYDTTLERDVIPVRDCFVGEPSMHSKGIRVTLT